jgi:uncharacterized protein (DUF2147 family)
MKKSILIIAALFFSTIFYSQNKSVVGKWKTIDDETGKPKSIIEIYENSGKIYAKVIEIFDEQHKKDVCTKCSGADKDKPILGMIVVKGLSKRGNEYKDGQILDPQNGKLYKSIIALEGNDKLKVRGYIGISLLGRTQYWYRIKGK